MADYYSIVYLDKPDLMNIQRWALAAEMQAGLGIAITKISICWFILRLLGPTNRWMRIVIWSNVAGITIITIVYTLFQGFSCIPLEKYWDPSVPGSCVGLATIGHVAVAANSKTLPSRCLETIK